VISYPFRYERPATLSEALTLIREPGAKVLAGGMSLIPMMKLRLAAPDVLVDLGGIPGTRGIDAINGHVRIGAMATHYELESSQALRSACPLLAECASTIGDVQVRNMGTIGGSVAHADPAADYPAALLAGSAAFVLTSAAGERVVPAEDFFVDTFTTALLPEELVTEIRIPRDGPSVGSAYEKRVQSASGFAVVGVAARIGLRDGAIASASVGVTGLSGKPFRAHNVEQMLQGKGGSPAEVQAAAGVVADGVDASSDIHASADYRSHLARVFTARALTRALTRAGAKA
jgi:aerobic carbon-monoxide dehydrogenase medium subunit